jgi:hypothetical protein
MKSLNGARKMQTKLIIKMIRKCFEQYQYEFEVPPLSNEEYETLSKQALTSLEEDPDTSLADHINDVVYEYLTQ